MIVHMIFSIMTINAKHIPNSPMFPAIFFIYQPPFLIVYVIFAKNKKKKEKPSNLTFPFMLLIVVNK